MSKKISIFVYLRWFLEDIMCKFKGIPTGCYCYDITSIEYINGKPIIHTKPCKYISHPDKDDRITGYCSKLKCEIMDECKEC